MRSRGPSPATDTKSRTRLTTERSALGQVSGRRSGQRLSASSSRGTGRCRSQTSSENASRGWRPGSARSSTVPSHVRTAMRPANERYRITMGTSGLHRPPKGCTWQEPGHGCSPDPAFTAAGSIVAAPQLGGTEPVRMASVISDHVIDRRIGDPGVRLRAAQVEPFVGGGPTMATSVPSVPRYGAGSRRGRTDGRPEGPVVWAPTPRRVIRFASASRRRPVTTSTSPRGDAAWRPTPSDWPCCWPA